MRKGIFITGTGTDIGKTFVTSHIVKKLLQNGISTGYYKPALSGAIKENKNIIPGDAKDVFEVSGLKDNYNSVVSYVFEESVSPHLAARINKVDINLIKIKQDFLKLSKKYEFLCVEGSGGLICPIYISKDKVILLEDIIKSLGLNIIIVSSADLGTINHTVLTVEYAKSKNIKIKGIILNNYDKGNLMHIDNKQTIERLTGAKVITCIPKVSNSENFSLDIKTQELMNLFDNIGEE